MPRPCSTCQHIRRAEIDRRLASGEPSKRIARDYGLNPSSLHRHRSNCVGLVASGPAMKEAARGTVALATLPSREELGGAYGDLRTRIDDIVKEDVLDPGADLRLRRVGPRAGRPTTPKPRARSSASIKR